MSPPADGGGGAVPLRLLVVLPDLSAGGAQRMTLRLLGLFDPRHYAITLLVLDGPGALSSCVPPNVRVVFPPRSRLLRVGKLATVRHALQHDVLIAAMELRASFCVHAAAAALHKPSIGWVRIAFSEYASQMSEKNRRKSRQIYGDFDRLVFVSDGAQASFERWFGSACPPGRRIYNPRPEHRPGLPRLEPAERPLIVAAGRLEARKGFDTLIAAAARLQERGLDFELALLGEGPLRTALEAQVRALGLDARVRLPGFVHDLPAWLERAWVHALSSRIEGLPGTILEAFAAGTPVVATECPHGPRELLADGRAGLLVPVDDAAALADALQAVIESPERRAALTAAGRERLAEFAPERILGQWTGLLDELARKTMGHE